MTPIASARRERRSPFCVGVKAFFRSKKFTTAKKHWMLYLMVLPAVVMIAIFNYAPMVGLVIAFQDFRLGDGLFGSEFVGLSVFNSILFDPASASFLEFRNTVFISLLRIATNFPIILIYTLLLHEIRRKKLRGAVQAISYIPFFISWISVGGMAYNLLALDGGIFNNIIEFFGGERIAFYNEPKYWWAILSLSSLWKGMGWATLIYMSGLGAINSELYDACKIDGGGRFRQMIHVTLPGLMNVIVLQLILDVGGIMSDNYDMILAMINGSQSLGSVTRVVGTLEFNAIVQGSQYSRATAYSMLRGLIGMILVLLANRLAKKTDSEGIL
ncbi:MAG: ABC transporter permease subunit [Candidatus Enteromonas sp.]|nr:ABC transporter permease subunit [Candidatus Enteromonas sp.]